MDTIDRINATAERIDNWCKRYPYYVFAGAIGFCLIADIIFRAIV